ncbi:glycoside hydrolase family 38 [Coriobacterium glomerans PW2]|uniref:Glycoside hydrolase family 38 n=1 Tax=Coriobacterium glomerans (strain ATCC 49209 / DSM 20642 / JCM 10262 / PW2) TaxID=700015 RepID=F2NBA9_CORGP|nr:glycoside hydrolase family 38 C-terminal domain-containing protein [Coriobacterium glomerans]AEB06645.1 glycoside hydrolase family 38 [Coriobacterium glomerans PW2]
MRRVHVIPHTHWDFEWYFTRQHARVQLAYHMAEVLEALETNRLDCYLLDGQMSILDDYLSDNPNKRAAIMRFVRERRLFIGPWYTQIDEMVTGGEAIVRNLQLGIRMADELGGAMRIGYLPDSFGQGRDMPKIYRGFDISGAVFWRGMPIERNARCFHWESDDGSSVCAVAIKDGYYAGAELIERDDCTDLLHRLDTDEVDHDLVLPLGGDQRCVDLDIRERIACVNASQHEFELVQSSYPAYFRAVEAIPGLPTYTGEFVDASCSKIHRGIYSSRADLKLIYDRLEHLMIDVVEPMMAIAADHGIEPQQGLVDNIWKAVARGQAHDSSGGCNSDATNRDIAHRGEVAIELAESLRDYLLRKLASGAPSGIDLLFWNPTAERADDVRQLEVSTRNPTFRLVDEDGQRVPFDILAQRRVDHAVLRRDRHAMIPDVIYRTTIALGLKIDPMDWTGLSIREGDEPRVPPETAASIENSCYRLRFEHGHLWLSDKRSGREHLDPIGFSDGGDEGDTYDFSPAFADWLLDLSLADANATGRQGAYQSELILSGTWWLPEDLAKRAAKTADTAVPYTLTLTLRAQDPTIGFDLRLDNTARDHRLRLVLATPISATESFADSPFGVAARPVIDPHLDVWRDIGYCEEPTALRPMIHFCNTHDESASWSFLALGEKEFELVGDSFDRLAITLLRGVGYLGRPDTLRRPGDASGLQTMAVETPDSQLPGARRMRGGICIDPTFDAAELQRRVRRLAMGGLGFQNQTIDRFTTPLQYFPINANPTRLIHRSRMRLEAPKLVVSSLRGTRSRDGYVLRLYNPAASTLVSPGSLSFSRQASVQLMNLNGEVLQAVAAAVDELELEAFAPGEIRTYGIFFPVETGQRAALDGRDAR